MNKLKLSIILSGIVVLFILGIVFFFERSKSIAQDNLKNAHQKKNVQKYRQLAQKEQSNTMAILWPQRKTVLWNSVRVGLENHVLCYWRPEKNTKKMRLDSCYVEGIIYNSYYTLPETPIFYDWSTCTVEMDGHKIGQYYDEGSCNRRSKGGHDEGIRINRPITIDEVNLEITIAID